MYILWREFINLKVVGLKRICVVHHDNTGRLQTVDKNNNLKFYNLINYFYKNKYTCCS